MKKETKVKKHFSSSRIPFSTLDPVQDLGLANFYRPNTSRPFSVVGEYASTTITSKEKSNQATQRISNRPIPTNAWYQNMIMLNGEPNSNHRAYTIPYLVDAAGPIPGLRVHNTHVMSSSLVIQANVNDMHGITLGRMDRTKGPSKNVSNAYSVKDMTQLALTLKWDDFGMTSSIVKGMAYATMSFDSLNKITEHGVFSPAIATEVPINPLIIVDQTKEWRCESGSSSTTLVSQEIQFTTPESDFTWLVFVSSPVLISCQSFGSKSIFVAEPSQGQASEEVMPFHFRIALSKPCTSGSNPVFCHQEQLHPTALLPGQGVYDYILRNHAHLYPGPKASAFYNIDSDETTAEIVFDWDVQAMSLPLYPIAENETEKEVIMYALPHHLDMMTTARSPTDRLYCTGSLLGPSCLIEGSNWTLQEVLPTISFGAERPPAYWSVPAIAKNLIKDIEFRLPDYFQRGVGDTYFSGKMIARLGRVLLITEELQNLCLAKDTSNDYHESKKSTDHLDASSGRDDYATICQNVTLPSDRAMTEAIQALRASVEIWINGTGQVPFVYDSAWGGVASCGCLFSEGECLNKFPDCPGFGNPGLNFGNAYYNDMHFHYGYHIFGAAVVAHFDPIWGREFFERVLLLVRNIANPSENDEFFPVMRHKDVYQGHSWASGIATWVRNGRNQESSSESVAAYESVALYGKVMAAIFADQGNRDDHSRALEVRRVGKLLTATELRSAKKYYHIKKNEEIQIYPSIYTPSVIGIMWQTMSQFQTWFGGAAYLATGIQLLPLTPIAGQRDEIEWTKEMYPSFEKNCNADKVCEEQGWSVLQLGALSTVGHAKLALSRAEFLPEEVFETAGGNGHSMSNTLWFIATREPLDDPLAVDLLPQKKKSKENAVVDCYRPETCTTDVLDTIVDIYSCRQRINFLIDNSGMSEKDACVEVARNQFPGKCGKCNPMEDEKKVVEEMKAAAARQCPPCSEQQCHSDLNRCPLYENSYVCTAGPNEAGCAPTAWEIVPWSCTECCELTDCPKISPLEISPLDDPAEGECPLCTKEQCKSNLCPIHGVAPYLCTDGDSVGGCSPHPWGLDDGQCNECCRVHEDC